MFKPVSRAGNYVVTPPLRTEDANSLVADANAEALAAAAHTAGRYNGTVQLPGGRIYLGGTGATAFTLDERHAGLVVRGAGPGKTVLVATTAGATLGLVSRLVDGRSPGTIINFNTVEVPNIADYAVREVIYFWTVQQGPNRSVRSRSVVDSFPIIPNRVQVTGGSSTGFSDFKHVKGFAVNPLAGAGQPIPAKSTSINIPDPANRAVFAPGDDVLLGDGPGINEFFGEWLTVESVNTMTGNVTFTTPTVQEYAADLACLVPGYQPFPPTGPRQHMSDITIRDLSIASPPPHDAEGFGLVRAGLRFAFDNVAFVPFPGEQLPTAPPDFTLATCGRVSVRDVTLAARLVVGSCQDAVFNNVTAPGVHCHEYARDCAFIACHITGRDGFTLGPRECQHIDLTNCTISGYASNAGVANVAFASDSSITGVQLRRPLNADDPVVLSGQNIRVTTLASDSPVTLATGSSGELLSPLAAGQLDDSSGSWDQPLTVRSSGVVRVPTFAASGDSRPDLIVVPPTIYRVGLKVRRQPNQIADLTQLLTEDPEADPLLAVRADGHLMTSNAEDAGGVEGQIVKKLKVYLPNGTVRYIALYDNL